MKKGIIIALLIIIIPIAIWQVYEWKDLQLHERETPSKQHGGSTLPSQPGEDNTNPVQSEPAKVLDILGQSDNLSVQQWSAMQTWRKDAKRSAEENPQLLFINGKGSKRQVALTFDDGPDGTVMPEVLNVLKQYQVQATFFVKANQIVNYRDLTKRAYTEGNQIASHAYSHQELDKMNGEDIRKEIVASDQAFERVLGVQPAMIRPPFGAINQTVLAVCEQEQEKVILWSIDTLDWSQPEPEHIARNVLDNVRPGEIILMHSCQNREASVKALPIIIQGLQEKGYEIVLLSELLELPAYKDQSTAKQ